MDLKDELLLNIRNKNTGIIPLKGTSMEPELFDGDILFVEVQTEYRAGDIIVFNYLNEGLLVHRVIGIERGAYICKGDNSKRYEIITRRQIVGKVVQYITGGKNEKE